MTTATITNGVSFDKVKELVGYMVEEGVFQSYPVQSEGKYFNNDIEELILDEEGNVFILLTQNDEPVMLPHLVEVVGY
jgi:hypothetical protein